VWQTRKTWLILLLSVGLLGAYWGVSAQETRTLTPRPVLPPDDEASKGGKSGKPLLPYAPVIPVGGQYPVEIPKMPVLPAAKQEVIPPPIPPVPGTLLPLPLPETKGNAVTPPQPFGSGLSLPTPPSLPMLPEVPENKGALTLPPMLPEKKGEVSLPPMQPVPAVVPEIKSTFTLPPMVPPVGMEVKGATPSPLTLPIDPKQVAPEPQTIPISPQSKGTGPLIVFPEPGPEAKKEPSPSLDPNKTVPPPTMANKFAPPTVEPSPRPPQVEEKTPAQAQQPAPAPTMPKGEPKTPAVKSFVLVRPAVKGDGVALPGPGSNINSYLLPRDEKAMVPCTPNRQQTMNNVLVPPPQIVVPNPSNDAALIKPIAGNETGASILLSMQTPQLTVEKRGPAMLRQGEPLHYQIVVRNVGSTPANQVRVEDEIPSDTRIVSSDPQPTIQGGRATWTIAAIPPGTERSVSITLQANTFSELANSTSVHVSTSAGTRPRALGGEPLSIRVSGPLTTVVGEQPVFEVRYANQTSQAVTGLVLHGTLSEGLSRPEGRLFEGDVGELPANGSKTIKLPVSAMAPGRHVVEMKITAAGGLQATAQAAIDVQPAIVPTSAIAPAVNSTSNFVAPAPVFPTAANTSGVVIRQSPISRLIAGREGDLRIEVTNHTGKPLRNVRIVETLPESLEYAGASDRGMFQTNSRAAHWFLEGLAPSQSVALTLRVNPKTAGTFGAEIAVQPEGVAETKVASTIAVEGFSDLQVRMVARDNPLETGKETVYEIQVANSGAAPATGVQLEVLLPDGLIPREAKGPTKHLTNQRQTVLFEKLPTLTAQSQVTYRITAFAHAPGNHRVRVNLTSDQSRTALVREQNLLVYDPSR
jgi:uncharacterized repeat protein (TIGR01451 family)